MAEKRDGPADAASRRAAAQSDPGENHAEAAAALLLRHREAPDKLLERIHHELHAAHGD